MYIDEVIRKYSLAFKAEHEKDPKYFFFENLEDSVVEYLRNEDTKDRIVDLLGTLFWDFETSINRKYFLGGMFEIMETDAFILGDVWNSLVKLGKTDEEIWRFVCPCFYKLEIFSSFPVCLKILEII